MDKKDLEVLNIISALLKNKKLTQKSLCEYIGLKDKIFSEWKAGNNTSYMKKLPQIAEFFGVSVDYLLGKEKSPVVTGLKEKHLRLITAYDRAEVPIQEAVDRLLKIDDKPVVVKIAARDGSFEEREITKEEWNKIKNLPDADL